MDCVELDAEATATAPTSTAPTRRNTTPMVVTVREPGIESRTAKPLDHG
jgi:hypothetical protein